ncbi:PH domain-like protein, partial [Martensiomyces pterosporus]
MSSWQRRWFEIKDGYLVHFQRLDEKDREMIPLHLCMVKRGPAQDRRNVFELIAPTRSYLLQAENNDELSAWKACLKQAIETSLYSHTPITQAIKDIPSSKHKPSSRQSVGTEGSGVNDSAAQAARMSKMRNPHGNDRCVDCGKRAPEWAAINLGVLMCIELGNHCVNRIYESMEPQQDDPQKPASQTSREAKLPYLVQKYANRLWVAKPESQEEADAKLVRAARLADMPMALEALAQGADVNAHDPKTGSTPLIEAVAMGDFGMLELLFLEGEDSGPRLAGGTALHFATRLGNVRVVWYLIRRGAEWDTPD